MAGTVKPERLIIAPAGGADAVTVPPTQPAPEMLGAPLRTSVLPVGGVGVRLVKLTPVNGVAESLEIVIRITVLAPGLRVVGCDGAELTTTVKSGLDAAHAGAPKVSTANAPACKSQVPMPPRWGRKRAKANKRFNLCVVMAAPSSHLTARPVMTLPGAK